MHYGRVISIFHFPLILPLGCVTAIPLGRCRFDYSKRIPNIGILCRVFSVGNPALEPYDQPFPARRLQQYSSSRSYGWTRIFYVRLDEPISDRLVSPS